LRREILGELGRRKELSGRERWINEEEKYGWNQKRQNPNIHPSEKNYMK
jgi:hypothetical protein